MRCEEAGIGLALNPHHFNRGEMVAKLGRLWQDPSFGRALQRHYKINMLGSGPIHRSALCGRQHFCAEMSAVMHAVACMIGDEYVATCLQKACRWQLLPLLNAELRNGL